MCSKMAASARREPSRRCGSNRRSSVSISAARSRWRRRRNVCDALGYALSSPPVIASAVSAFGQYLVTGIATGASFALVALGFVAIYRVTHVVNFAQGTFAMLGG